MKMAKASDADMEMAIELTNALEKLSSQWGALMPEKIEVISGNEESERFDIDDHEQCKRALEYLILLARSASLFRVVFGMTVLLDPRNKIVDPDVDILERHPDFVDIAQTTKAVYLVATGEITNGMEQYTRHDVCPPNCDAEKLYTTPQAVNAELLAALQSMVVAFHPAEHEIEDSNEAYMLEWFPEWTKARAVLKKVGGAA